MDATNITDRNALAARLAQLDAPALRAIYRALRAFAQGQDATETDAVFEAGCIRALGARNLNRPLVGGERWVFGAIVHAEAVLVGEVGMLTDEHLAGRKALAEIVFRAQGAQRSAAA
jgi:hypothetical protein